MAALSPQDILGAAYRLNDWLNFYWNFYVAFTGVVIGWVFNSKGWSTAQRVVVTLFYLGFVAVSLDALAGTYEALNAVAARLQEMLPQDDMLPKALMAKIGAKNKLLGLGLHLLGDGLVLVCIWRFTRKPAEPEPAAPSPPTQS
jgi:hypothetical protein